MNRPTTFMPQNPQDTASGAASEHRSWWLRHLWEITPLQDVFWFSAAALLLWLGYLLRGVFIPVLVGFTGAYVVNPPLTWAQRKWRWPRSLLIGVTLVLLLSSCIVAALILIPQVIDQTERLVRRAPRYINTLTIKLQDRVDPDVLQLLQDAGLQLPRDGRELAERLLGSLGSALGIAASVLETTTWLVIASLLIPIYFCFFAWNFNIIVDRMKMYLPAASRQSTLRVLRRMDSVVGQFIRGRVLVVIAMAVMFSIAFLLAGVPYWFLIGTLTGLLSFVPYLAVVGWLLAMLMTWIEAQTGTAQVTWTTVVIWPTVAYSVVQLIEGWMITPWVQSQSMHINPVTVFVILMIGGSAAGIYGLLLALPVAGCVRILAEEAFAPKLGQWAADATNSASET